MHPRPPPALLAIAVIVAVLAGGCTGTVPQPPPTGTTVGGDGPTVTVTATGPASTDATPSAGMTATPGPPTPAATSPAATPSALPTTDSGDAPSTDATTAVPTRTVSPTATITAGSTPTPTVEISATVTATVTSPSTPPGSAGYAEPELKYLLLDRYGEDRFFYCDPDYYPVSRGDELEKALEAFPAIVNDTAEFAAITERTGLRPPYTDEAKLTIYREHKKLRALPLTPATADSYAYSIALGTEADGRRVSGTVRTDGTIREERSEAAILACPICLPEGARIETPAGPVPVEEVREGTSVWTVDAAGDRVAVPVLRTSRTRAPPRHAVVRLGLSDGRRVAASPGHPDAAGRPLGLLRVGDPLDGASVASVQTVPYDGALLYDLLPAGPTGRYWADGVQLGSTLR